MVRNYVKKKDGPKYSEEKLFRALEEIRASRVSIHKASVLYGIPFATLYCRIKGTRGTIKKTKGRTTALPENIENVLAVSIKTLAKWGFGLSRKEIIELVGQFVSINELRTPFKDGVPGEDWFLNFKKRHNLSIRKPEPLEYARKKAATDPFIIYGYFKLLKKTLVELDLENKPDRIWNLDESSLSIDPSKSRVVGEKGQSSSRVTSTSGRENTTFVLACNAAGQRVPPLIIYKGKNMWDQWKASPDKEFPGTAYAATPNGWMETGIFKSYFEKTLVPALGDERPVLVIYDGHSTHVSLDLVEHALNQGITILKLPAHTSDILQPLDVSVFKSYKQKWDQTVATWQRQHIGQKLPKSLFSQFLGETWTKVSEDVIKNGFRKTGIFPFNADVVPKENFSKEALMRWERHQEQTERDEQGKNMDLPRDVEHVDSARRSNASSPSLLPPAPQLPISANVVPSIPQTSNDNLIQSSIPQAQHFHENAACNAETSQTASIEQLILSTIHQKQLPNNVKRRKVASGAEVITSAEIIEVLKKKEQAKSTNKQKTRKKSEKKGKETKKISDSDGDITDAESVKTKPDPVKKMKNKKQQRKKLKQTKMSEDSESSEGKVSYAESDASESMEEEWLEDEFVDEQVSSDKENDDIRNEQEPVTENENKIRKAKEEKKKGATKAHRIEQKETEKEEKQEEARKEFQEMVVNKWVIVKYALKKGVKYYVGVLQKIVGQRWEVKFVRRKGSVFRWPIIDDIDHITADSIVQILPNPEITKRGIISFDFKFRNMIIS